MIRICALLRDRGHRLLALAALALVCATVVLAHSGPEGSHAMEEDGGGGMAMICLAVLSGALGLVAATGGRVALATPRPPRRLDSPQRTRPRRGETTAFRARAGPELLQVFRT